jgi:hypothetical protein
VRNDEKGALTRKAQEAAEGSRDLRNWRAEKKIRLLWRICEEIYAERILLRDKGVESVANRICRRGEAVYAV